MHFQRITLVHYHELGLKGHNRATFEKRLMRNLEVLLEDAPVHEITRISGRVLVVEDTPIRRLRSFEVPAPYPRTRACLTEPRMLELRESLISLLRREVSE